MGSDKGNYIIKNGYGQNGYGILTVSGRGDAHSTENYNSGGFSSSVNTYLASGSQDCFLVANGFNVDSATSTATLIDVTNYSKLVLKAAFVTHTTVSPTFYAGLSTSASATYNSFTKQFSSISTQAAGSAKSVTYTLDLSSITGSYYIKFVARNTSSSVAYSHGVRIYDMYFEE